MIEIDIIGPLFDPPLVEGGEPVLLDGWHVNTTPEGLAARADLEPFVVMPGRLRRVWAGDDPLSPAFTVALWFADEAQGAILWAAGEDG
ncbi:hypothetical protein [Brevundimonas goettingensis]|jgi:hypothetical protein|uniref:Uncharacterized protein n=1 Tax=Brevundimonas goettingensis TaxID=2774190 RepID=A0A975GVM6_9CAUL|nr:hypothetical protein [Brevundimonas goettingensis]QTC91587.1 hypothetical protein IFJ75_01215 [Brevundimonas goettingensis]